MANNLGKISIDLSQRTVGKTRLLWNRLTPTKGGRSVTRSLVSLSSNGDLKISVESNGLEVQGERLASSEFYARCLYNAGVQEIEISEGRSQREIKKILNALSDGGLEKAKGVLENRHLELEVESSVLPMSMTWSDFYAQAAPLDGEMVDNIKDKSMSVGGGLGVVGGMIGGLFADHAIAWWFVGGVLGSITFRALSPFIVYGYKKFKLPHDYKNCKLAAETSNPILLSKLAKSWNYLIRVQVVKNIHTSQDILDGFGAVYGLGGDNHHCVSKELAKSIRVSDVVLSRLLVDPNEEVRTAARENPRVLEPMKAATESSSAEELAELAKNPIWLVRREVALSPYVSEETLGELLNKDTHEEVRKAVPEHPKVKALIEQAKSSRSPEELTSLARKPFPCVRTVAAENEFTPGSVLGELAKDDESWMVKLAAAENPRTPWESAAIVLSEIRKDKYWEETTESNCVGGHYVSIEKVTVTRYAYIDRSLAIAREILEIHVRNREKIMNRLKELNYELYEALKK